MFRSCRVLVMVAVMALATVEPMACRSAGDADMAKSKTAGVPSASLSMKPRAKVGAYYFDGWAGHRQVDGNPAWAKNAPSHLTQVLVEKFPEREPVWGWRDDSQEIMERQIDLAADAGISFFSFCWYWNEQGDERAIRENPTHTSLELFLKARNNQRMEFCLMVANHQGAELLTEEAWRKAADLWIPYLKHPRAVKVGGKPLLIIYWPHKGNKAGFDYLQAAARKAGLPGVTIAACDGGPPEMGYACATHYNFALGWNKGLEVRKYQDLADSIKERCWVMGTVQQPYMPLVSAGWDNRPWVGPENMGQPPCWYYAEGRTPERLAGFLQDAIKWMDEHPHETTAERIVMIYAWNEFGEGGYLAPTRGDPEGKFLKAVRSAILPEGSGQ